MGYIYVNASITSMSDFPSVRFRIQCFSALLLCSGAGIIEGSITVVEHNPLYLMVKI